MLRAGDMPIILTADGPSLGGFVCPLTTIEADMWKWGQVRPGDLVHFDIISLGAALTARTEITTRIDAVAGVATTGTQIDAEQVCIPDQPPL
jgi:allophanate hydrolase subunit 2